jgi:hypothetical protein
MSIERIRRKLSFPDGQLTNTQNQTKPKDLGGFKDFIGKHKDGSFVICGCGASLKNFDNFNNHIAIGVNDAGRQVWCKYLVVVNTENTFKWDRWKHVKNNTAECVFTHLPNLPIDGEKKVVVNLGKYGGRDLENYGFIDYTTNSPYMAIIIAYQMGASKIAIVGVDFTQHHFFGETGTHIVNRQIDQTMTEYSELGKALTEKGIKIANLSTESMIDSWPKMTLEEFETI